MKIKNEEVLVDLLANSLTRIEDYIDKEIKTIQDTLIWYNNDLIEGVPSKVRLKHTLWMLLWQELYQSDESIYNAHDIVKVRDKYQERKDTNETQSK
jgi:hypothetical protein